MRKKKRGASMMVSYALLIVIAIGLSAAVYPFLKARLPIDNVECPSDLSLSIESVSCDRATQSISLKMLNRGLFNITGAYVRFAEASKSIRPQVNFKREAYLKGNINDFSPLAPGQYTALLKYPVGSLSSSPPDSDFVVEVQPAIFKKGVMVPCANKIITQTIKCTSEAAGWFEQETGNEIGCEGNWNSTYTCNKTYDGFWGTKGTATDGNFAALYVNYTTQTNAIWNRTGPSSNWTVRYGFEEGADKVITSGLEDCWNETKLQFVLEINNTPSGANKKMNFYCRKNDGNLTSLHQDSGWPNSRYIFEEKMSWRLD